MENGLGVAGRGRVAGSVANILLGVLFTKSFCCIDNCCELNTVTEISLVTGSDSGFLLPVANTPLARTAKPAVKIQIPAAKTTANPFFLDFLRLLR